MRALDGTAIAGPLLEYFSEEMTTAVGTCSHCGASPMIAELRVYSHAPGAVACCSNCGTVLIVPVTIRDTLEVDLANFRLVAAEGAE